MLGCWEIWIFTATDIMVYYARHSLKILVCKGTNIRVRDGICDFLVLGTTGTDITVRDSIFNTFLSFRPMFLTLFFFLVQPLLTFLSTF